MPQTFALNLHTIIPSYAAFIVLSTYTTDQQGYFQLILLHEDLGHYIPFDDMYSYSFLSLLGCDSFAVCLSEVMEGDAGVMPNECNGLSITDTCQFLHDIV